MKKYEKPIEEEKLICVPRNLDLMPYRDERDFGLLQRLIRNAFLKMILRDAFVIPSMARL